MPLPAALWPPAPRAPTSVPAPTQGRCRPSPACSPSQVCPAVLLTTRSGWVSSQRCGFHSTGTVACWLRPVATVCQLVAVPIWVGAGRVVVVPSPSCPRRWRPRPRGCRWCAPLRCVSHQRRRSASWCRCRSGWGCCDWWWCCRPAGRTCSGPRPRGCRWCAPPRCGSCRRRPSSTPLRRPPRWARAGWWWCRRRSGRSRCDPRPRGCR